MPTLSDFGQTSAPKGAVVGAARNTGGVNLATRTLAPGSNPVTQRQAESNAAMQSSSYQNSLKAIQNAGMAQRQSDTTGYLSTLPKDINGNPMSGNDTYYGMGIYKSPTSPQGPYVPTDTGTTVDQNIAAADAKANYQASLRSMLAGLAGNVSTGDYAQDAITNASRASQRASIQAELNGMSGNSSGVGALTAPLSPMDKLSTSPQGTTSNNPSSIAMNGSQPPVTGGIKSGGNVSPVTSGGTKVQQNAPYTPLPGNEYGPAIPGHDPNAPMNSGMTGGQQGAGDQQSTQNGTQYTMSDGTGENNGGSSTSGMQGQETSPQTMLNQASVNLGLSGLTPNIQSILAPVFNSMILRSSAAGDTLSREVGDIQLNREIAQKIFDNGKTLALESRDRQLQVESDLYDLQQTHLQEGQRKALAEVQDAQDLQNVQNARAEYLQRQANIDQEIQDRAYLAKTGESNNSAGLAWASRNLQRGNAALENIISQAAVETQHWASQRLGIVNDYNLSVRDADTKLKNDTGGIFADYNKQINDLKNNELADVEKNNQAITSAYGNYNKELEGAYKDYGDSVENAHLKMVDQNIALSRIVFDQQQSALTRLQTTWEQTGGTSNSAIDAAAQAARNMGIPESMIQPYTTGQMTNTGLTNVYKTQAYQYMQPDMWKDNPEGQSVMSMLGGVNFPNENEMVSAFNSVGQQAAAGNIDIARNKVISYAMNQMTPEQKKQITDGQDIVRQAKNLQQFITDNKDALENAGIYQKKAQDALTLLNQSKDPTLQTFYGMVTKLAATDMHQLYGARLTETEIGFGKDFLGQTNEPLGNVINKTDQLVKDVNGFIDQDVSNALNLTSPSSLGTNTNAPQTGGTAIDLLKNLENKYWNSGNTSTNLPRSGAKGGGYDQDVGYASFDNNSPLASYVSNNGFRITQYYNGTFDQNHPQELTGSNMPVFSDGRQTHESYNISPGIPGQRNVPAPAFESGEVISVQKSTKGYGNSIRVKDSNGNTWIYGHLDKINVKKGDMLQAGQHLGTIGKSGWATGITMHLEARGPDGKPFDFAATQAPIKNFAFINFNS